MQGEKDAKKCSFSSYYENAAPRRAAEGGRGSKNAATIVFERAAVRRPSSPAPRRAASSAGHAVRLALLLAGICAFSLVFALTLTNSSLPGETLAVFKSAMDGAGADERTDEQLGRLQLVRLPGLLSVFAPSDAPILPLSIQKSATDADETARLYSTSGAEVLSVLSGTVRSIDPVGSGRGGSVTVAHSGGIEITYSGLSEILVERGQPVVQRTKLGRLALDVLYIKITRDGRPVDPLEFLGAAARLG